MKDNARKAAVEVFKKDCLIRLGTCIAPVGKSNFGKTILTMELTLPDGNTIKHELKTGDHLDLCIRGNNIIFIESNTELGVNPDGYDTYFMSKKELLEDIKTLQQAYNLMRG